MPAAERAGSMREYHASPTLRPSSISTIPAISSKPITGSPGRRSPTASRTSRNRFAASGSTRIDAIGPVPPTVVVASDQGDVR